MKNKFIALMFFGLSAQAGERVKFFEVFPHDVSQKIINGDAQKAVCSGNSAKYAPDFKITLSIPKAEKGTALDQAAKDKAKFMAMVRVYVKRWMFDDMSNFKEGNRYDMDHQAYQPADQASIAQFYGKATFTLRSAPMHLDPAEWFPERYVSLFVDPSKRSAVMVPKTHFLKNGEDFVGVPGDDAMYFVGAFTRKALSLNSFYSIGEKDGKAYRISYSFAQDLSALKNRYVILDKDESVSHAVSHVKLNWLNYFERNVTVTESPKENGTFEIYAKMNLDEFCKSASSLTSLTVK